MILMIIELLCCSGKTSFGLIDPIKGQLLILKGNGECACGFSSCQNRFRLALEWPLENGSNLGTVHQGDRTFPVGKEQFQSE